MQIKKGEDLNTNNYDLNHVANPEPVHKDLEINNTNILSSTETPECTNSGKAFSTAHDEVLFGRSHPSSMSALTLTDFTGPRPLSVKELLVNNAGPRPNTPEMDSCSKSNDSFCKRHTLDTVCNKNLISVLQKHPRKIDYDLVMQQQARIKSTWPIISSEALKCQPHFARLYQQIKSFNLPNFLGAQVQLHSALNIDMWEKLLHNYHDKEVCVFLKYGWPVGYDTNEPPTSVDNNHHSARKDEHHVLNFIQTEMEHGALIGPFREPPFQP